MKVWKDVPGYEGVYQASTDGEIKAISGPTAGRLFNRVCTNPSGYFACILTKDRKAKQRLLHRVIALTFLGPSDLEVNHKNGIKTDNRIENLEYVSHAENIRHAYRLGLCQREKGEESPNSILTEAQVKIILEVPRAHGSGVALAREFGVSTSTISAIRHGRLWRHI